MNEVLKAIKERRSTRKFNSVKLEAEKLDLILEAGVYAPSAHNDQPWHFSVIQNRNLLDEINKASKEGAKDFDDVIIQRIVNNDKVDIFYNAQTVVFVSGRKEAMMPVVDCAAATQNMLLAAHSLDVASCWVGLVNFAIAGENGEAYKKRLQIPVGYELQYAVALGYRDIHSTNAPKRVEGTITFVE